MIILQKPYKKIMPSIILIIKEEKNFIHNYISLTKIFLTIQIIYFLKR